MKKLLLLLAIIIIFTLTACDPPTNEVDCAQNPYHDDCLEEPNPVDVDCKITPNHEDCPDPDPIEVDCEVTPNHEDCEEDPVITECIDGYHIVNGQCVEDDVIVEAVMVFDENKPVEDLVDDFTYNITSIPTYQNTEDLGITYVKITEFLELTKFGTKTLTVEKNALLNLSYRYFPGVNKDEYYDYTMRFSASDNKIYINDYDFFSAITLEINQDYETELELVDSWWYQAPAYMNLDLRDYDIDIILEENDYFIPLYLANLLLTGDYINVYESPDKLIIFDDPEEIYLLVEDMIKETDQYEVNIVKHTTNFTKLLLNHFYGLKNHKGISDYEEVITELNYDEADSITDLQYKQNELILYLDDLHTSIYSYGFKNDGYEPVIPDVLPDKIDQFYESLSNYECLPREGMTLLDYEEGYLLKVYDFSLDTKTIFEDLKSDINQYKPLYIDLRCNTGGMLSGVLDLMPYFTNDTFALHTKIPLSNIRISRIYDYPEDIALKNDLYLLTSKVTFSAANLFASIFKQENLGTIIGTDTSGGACAIAFTVLPDSSIMIYSSHFAMTDANYQLIEEGISPDVYALEAYGVKDPLDFIEALFYDNYAYQLTDIYDGLSVQLQLDYISNNPSIYLNSYTVQLFDPVTNALISEDTYNADNFNHTYNLNQELNIKIQVNFSYNDHQLTTYLIDDIQVRSNN